MNMNQQIPGQPPVAVPPAQEVPRRSYYTGDTRSKSALLASVLSLMPGLGQIYVGYYQQGFINILVVGSLIAVLNEGIGGLEPLCGLFLAFFWLYNIVDAYRKASLYNQALAGLGPTELPEDIQTPSRQSTLLGGIVLILFGALALAHTKFGYSLAWVEDWWPLALVIIGVYLLYRSWIDWNASAESDS